MIATAWKPEEEIRISLSGHPRVAVFSCGICSNLKGTGGAGGIRIFRGMLKKWGKKEVLGKVINACCSQAIMEQAVGKYIFSRAQKPDALVVLACAGGVKSAMLCLPGIPVIGALDTLGGMVITRETGLVAQSLCQGCGQCVISLTGGICPLDACPGKRRYSPCREAPGTGETCAKDPARPCVWKIILSQGADLEALKELKHLHKAGAKPEKTPPPPSQTPAMVRKIVGKAMAGTGRLAWLVKTIK